MDYRQHRLMGILAVLLGTVTAALWWWEAPEEESDPLATAPVWSVNADSIVRIEVVRAAGSLVLESSEAGWTIVEPEHFEADPERVKELTTALASIEHGVPIVAADPAEFGLGEPPVAKVTVSSREGEPQTLSFGSETPVGWSTYARTAAGVVVAVPGKPIADLTAGAEHYRDRRILRFAPELVRSVTLSSAQGTLRVHGVERPEPSPNGPPLNWWLDGFTRADPDQVDDLVTGLLMLRFDAIQVAAPAIDQPVVTAEVETTQRTWTLHVGPSDGSFSLVELVGGPSGMVLSDSLAILGMGPTDLGDSRAFPYDPDTTDRIEVVAGARHWIAVRNGPSWEVDGKESASAAEVATAVDQASISYAREPVPPAPSVALSVIVGEGPNRRQVDLGPATGELAVAVDAGGGAPYRVAEQDLAALRSLFPP